MGRAVGICRAAENQDMKRTHYGSTDARKVYVGAKSINLEFTVDAARKLLVALARAPKNVTLTVITARKRVVISARD